MKKQTDYEHMSVFEQIEAGLKESVAQAQGTLALRTTTLPLPAPKLTKNRIKLIRRKTGMSRLVFAAFLNVPKRTLESWEQGLRIPKAGEARLLQLMETSPAELVSLVNAASASTKG